MSRKEQLNIAQPKTRNIQDAAKKRLETRITLAMQAEGLLEPDGALDMIHPDQRVKLDTDWTPTEDNLDEVWKVAVSGCNEETIARVGCKVTDSIYFQLKTLYPELEETIVTARRTGEAIAARVILNELLDKTSKNRVTTAQFYLKMRSDWGKNLNMQLPNISNQDVGKLSNDEILKQLTSATRKILQDNPTEIEE